MKRKITALLLMIVLASLHLACGKKAATPAPAPAAGQAFPTSLGFEQPEALK